MPEAPSLVLVTRSEPGATRFTDDLRNGLHPLTNYQIIKAPMTTIVPVPRKDERLERPTGLLITSPQALGFALPEEKLPVFAVGEASASAARALGFPVASVGPGQVSAAFLDSIPQDEVLLHLSGQHLSQNLAAAFAERGVRYIRQIVYDARPVNAWPPSADAFLTDVGNKIVTFLSARAAQTFAKLMERKLASSVDPIITAICASQRIADAAAEQFPFSNCHITGSTDASSFVDFIRTGRT
ncbi:MAG: uroporphyrinogen-III synthase [Pseudomonadota bacterium]